MSDFANRALIVAQFRSSAVSLDRMVRAAEDPASNGGMDITQRELATLADDAHGLAEGELSDLRVRANFPYRDALTAPGLVDDVALAILSQSLGRNHARVRPEHTDTPVAREADEVSEAINNGINAFINHDNEHAIAAITQGVPALIARTTTRQGRIEARRTVASLEELIDLLGGYPEIPAAVQWREQVRAARDAIVASEPKG